MNEEAKEKLQTLWERIEELNLNVGLSESTMKELKAKISSGIAKCDISDRYGFYAKEATTFGNLLKFIDGLQPIV